MNRYCLINLLEDALAAARRFNAEQPEPGEFVVVQVAMKIGGSHREDAAG